MSASIFNYISEVIINPDEVPVEKDGFYSENISQNVPTYFLAVIIINGSIGILSIIFLFPFKIAENDENAKLEYLKVYR
jgi:hypothetical protein